MTYILRYNTLSFLNIIYKKRKRILKSLLIFTIFFIKEEKLKVNQNKN